MKVTLKKTTLLFVMLFSLTAGFCQSFDITPALPVDTNYKIGKLANGLTYYIREAKNPQGQAEFFIVHNVGALQENDNQRGLAHFLEHMAFNGTKNFPDKALLDYFASIGVKFGYNVNAYTAMDRTVYNISAVPVKVRSTIIDTALLALHDWSHYISCEQEEIDKERGVVHEEWRRGDDARTRMMKGINKAIQTGSRFAQRDPIGLMEVVDNFSRETLLDYYHKWYRPDLQAIIVIGDIDVKDIEQRIKARFSSIPKTENGAVREVYSIPENRTPIVSYLTDPESKAVSVRMVVKIPHRTTQERSSYLATFDQLTQSLFLNMFQARTTEATSKKDAPCKAIIPVFGEVVYACSTFSTTAVPKDSKSTLEALKSIVTEIEKVTKYGFEPEELEKSRAGILRGIETLYKRSKESTNKDYVSAAVDHFTRDSPLLDIDANYKLSKELLHKITIEDINLAVERILSDKNRVIIFNAPESDKEYLPTEDEVLAMLEEVKSGKLDKFVPVSDKQIKKPNIQSPGKIVSSRTVTSKDYKIKYEKQLDSTTEWVLANGAKVIWKEERTGDKTIKLKAFRPGGYSLPLDPLDLRLMQLFLSNYSVNGLNREDLIKWSSKTRSSVRTGVDYRYNEFSGSFIQQESDNFFSLLYMYFTDVTAQQRDVNNLKARLIKSLETSPSENTKFNDSVNKLKYVNRPMDVKFNKAYLENISAKKLEDLYAKSFGNPAGYTFIFTGPMSAQDGKEYIAKYIASLENKETEQVKYAYKEPELSKGEVTLRYMAPNMLSSKASVSRVYHHKVNYTSENKLIAKYITYILRDRYMHSIREEKGGTYHVGVVNELLDLPTPTLSFSIDFDTDPTLVDELLEIVQLEIDQLVKNGPTEKEMKEINLYLSKMHKESKKETNWANIIINALKGEEDLTSNEEKLINTMSLKEIHKFAKDFFKTTNRMTFIFEPIL